MFKAAAAFGQQSVGLFLSAGVVYQPRSEWPVASLSCSQVQSGKGSKSGLLALTLCRLCVHVARLVHYQNKRGHADPTQP